jgi:hypothetical protein
MATQFQETYSSSVFGGGTGVPINGADLNDPNVLLGLARAKGGAVASAAEEIADPTRGILSTVGEKFKNAFTGFVDIISIPNQVVAGALSSKYTISEAVKKNINVSEVWFGKPDPKNSTMQKVGSFTVRTAVDILTDPLTYLTFGASGVGKLGIIGIGAIKKVGLGENAAKQLGGHFLRNFEKDSFVDVALNEKGFDVHKYTQALLAQKSGRAVSKEIFNANKNKVEKILSREQVGILDDELDVLLKASIDAPLDEGYAAMAVGKLLEKAPQLTETLIDKGGIKFMGRTILESQRLHAAMDMIPGMSVIDNLTLPVRGALAGVFSTAHQRMADGTYKRLPQEFADFMRKIESLTETTTDKRLLGLKNIVSENKLTLEESKEILVAMEANKPLANERLEAVRKLLQGYTDEEVMFLKERGLPVTTLENYVPHMFTPEALKEIYARLPASSNLRQKIRSEMDREVLKFVGQTTGKVHVGRAEQFGLLKKFTAESEEEIISRVNQSVAKMEGDITKLEDDIVKLSAVANDFFSEKVSDDLARFMDDLVPSDKENFTQLLKVIKQEVGQLDIDKLAKARAQKTMSAGMKIKATKEISKKIKNTPPEVLAKLQEKLNNKELYSLQDTELFNDAIRTKLELSGVPQVSTVKKLTANEVDEAADALAKKLELKVSAKRYTDISANLDRQALSKVIESMKNAYEVNPTGVKRILDQVIGNKQKIASLLADIDLEKLAAKQGLSELPSEAIYYSSKGTGEIFRVAQASVAEAREAGFMFEDDIVLALAAKSAQNIRDGFSFEFMRTVAHRFGSTVERPGWRKIESAGFERAGIQIDNALGKQVEDRFYPPQIAAAVEEMMTRTVTDPGSKGFLAAYDKVQNLWKASVTSIWPAFHGLNAISNVLQNYLDIGIAAFNPAVNAQASAMIKIDLNLRKLERLSMKAGKEADAAREEMAEILSKKVFTDITGVEWTYGELRMHMQRNNIAFNPGHNVGSLDTTTQGRVEQLYDSTDSVLVKAAKNANVFSVTSLPYKTGREFAQIVEAQARVLNFMNNLKNTGDPLLAAQRTKMFLFDYGNLTRVEKTILKRLMPFYTFSRKNIELQARALLTTPGRITSELTALRNLGMVLSGDEITEEEKKMLPQWALNGIGILAERRGSTIEALTTLRSPIEQPFQQLQPGNLLGSISPLIKLPLEQITGYSLYNGKMLSDVTNAAVFKEAPNAVKEFIGFTEIRGTYPDGKPYLWYESLRPERMNILLSLPPTTRVFSAIKQLDNADVSTKGKILQQLTGIRVNSFDLEKEQIKRQRETVEQLTNLLDNAGVVATFSKTYLPKEVY